MGVISSALGHTDDRRHCDENFFNKAGDTGCGCPDGPRDPTTSPVCAGLPVSLPVGGRWLLATATSLLFAAATSLDCDASGGFSHGAAWTLPSRLGKLSCEASGSPRRFALSGDRLEPAPLPAPAGCSVAIVAAAVAWKPGGCRLLELSSLPGRAANGGSVRDMAPPLPVTTILRLCAMHGLAWQKTCMLQRSSKRTSAVLCAVTAVSAVSAVCAKAHGWLAR